MKEIKNPAYLLHSVRGAGLLTIPEGGISNEHVPAWLWCKVLVIKGYAAYLFVGEKVPHEIGLFPLNKPVVFSIVEKSSLFVPFNHVLLLFGS